MQRAQWLLFLGFAIGCAPPPISRPSAPLTAGAGVPDDVQEEADDIDRICSQREGQLVFDYQKGKEDQEEFKTILGSVTGGVGTAGGVAGGVGAFVAKEEDVKTITGVSGFITAGLGAVGGIVTAVVTPGKEQMETSQAALVAIEEKKKKARAALEGKESFGDEEKAKWSEARAELEKVCK
ncbi:MAG: hypothetical protein HOW73_32700 [Polyangiaceae bacterium]|nr:hypothetical protein [Polyangiaceae bacterium]